MSSKFIPCLRDDEGGDETTDIHLASGLQNPAFSMHFDTFGLDEGYITLHVIWEKYFDDPLVTTG